MRQKIVAIVVRIVILFVGNKTYFICLSYIGLAGRITILGVSQEWRTTNEGKVNYKRTKTNNA